MGLDRVLAADLNDARAARDAHEAIAIKTKEYATKIAERALEPERGERDETPVELSQSEAFKVGASAEFGAVVSDLLLCGEYDGCRLPTRRFRSSTDLMQGKLRYIALADSNEKAEKILPRVVLKSQKSDDGEKQGKEGNVLEETAVDPLPDRVIEQVVSRSLRTMPF